MPNISRNGGTVVAGGAAVIAVGGYMLYKHEKNKKAAATASAQSSAANSAYGYGSEFGYGSYGYGGFGPDLYANSSAYGYGAYGYGDYNPYTGQYLGAAGGGYPTTVATNSNSEWTQEALSALEQQGVTNTTALAAIGLYLAGQPLSSSQAQIIQEATAVAGYPPQSGSDGYPPAIHYATSGGQSGSGSGSGSGTGTSSAGWSFPAPTGLRASNQAKGGYRLQWNPVVGPSGQKASGYTVATYNSGGTEVDQFKVSGTSTAEYGKGGKGLSKGTYHTNVWANGGPVAPQHASVTVSLKG